MKTSQTIQNTIKEKEGGGGGGGWDGCLRTIFPAMFYVHQLQLHIHLHLKVVKKSRKEEIIS